MATPAGSMVHGRQVLLSQLPSVDRLINSAAAKQLVNAHGATLVAHTARALLDDLRQQARIGSLQEAALHPDLLDQALNQRCKSRLAYRMTQVINLTGTVIHTNLGRAVLPQAALDHIAAMMAGPNNLEFDLASASRGDRDSLVEGLICDITGAQAATVVNNNAAAVLLSIAALAGTQSSRREVIVSRGELVEIGGAFRMPDVMASAGAQMVEVGTTNRTHLADYERAITTSTGLLMKVHTSNYAVQGFTAAVTEEQLAPLAQQRGIALVTDLGSGSLIDMGAWGLPQEPTPQQMLAAGCDVVTFSGDKLLGGPQAGLIVGRKDLIGRIRKYPMKRALRLSKLPLAALEATLTLYLKPDLLTRDLPTLRMLTRPLAQIERTAQALLTPLAQALAPRYLTSTVRMNSQIGSGSLPVERLPSAGLAIAPVLSGKRGAGTALDALARALRELPTPVLGRVTENQLMLDCRCLEDSLPLLAQLPALREVLGMDVP